jgi:hypothetical protein
MTTMSLVTCMPKKSTSVLKETMKPFSVNLTPVDADNMEYLIDRLNVRQGAIAISRAMAITRQLLDILDDAEKVLIQKDGATQEVKFLL